MTATTEDQMEARETKINNYNKHEYHVQHIILSMTSTCLGTKIKNLKFAHEMWDAVKTDATTKSTLFLLNVEDQLTSMKLTENNDAFKNYCMISNTTISTADGHKLKGSERVMSGLSYRIE